MTKIRLLSCTQASHLATGYGTVARELLSRFHADGRFEVMELATDADWFAPRPPWGFIPATPEPGNERELSVYRSNQLNVFGKWKFEQVCVEFQPHIVFDVRDPWMCSYQADSPLRPYFNLVWSPTVDADPLADQWIEQFTRADALFPYTGYGAEVIIRQSQGRANVVAPAHLCVDANIFTPVKDKAAHKESFGLRGDSKIVGMVARNQRRKLFGDLMEAVRGIEDKNLFLYLHTDWPGLCWDIPRLLRETKMTERTLFTYVCLACSHIFPSFFRDAGTPCIACGNMSARLPTIQGQVSTEALARIYNCFDVYAQVYNMEGSGLPLAEAAACGVPVIGVDYAGGGYVTRELGGQLVDVVGYYREPETHRRVAVPSINHLRQVIEHEVKLTSRIRRANGMRSRELAIQKFNWDKSFRLMADYMATLPMRSWSTPKVIHQPNMSYPAGLDGMSFVRWGMAHIGGRPDLCDSFLAVRMVKDLNWGETQSPGGISYVYDIGQYPPCAPFYRFGYEQAVQIMLALCEEKNAWEEERVRRADWPS